MYQRTHIVDNRTFLLGLDKLYRDCMKRHESNELLGCARQVASVLQVMPASVPVEGYYTEDRRLTEYFLLMRALQKVGVERTSEVDALPEFQRLLAITSAPLYGKPLWDRYLLPGGLDALSQALFKTKPDWSLQQLLEVAYNAALEMDDYSLVGLAARIRDGVVLAALRESVVLYAAVMVGSALMAEPPRYIWNVDRELAEQARRFINAFNSLFGEELPPPDPAQAAHYWHACEDNEIEGRCVRLGYNDAISPPLNYHWAICRRQDDNLGVHEFWNPELWTTERYRIALRFYGRCPAI
jgi:hypothetical protein